MIRFAVAAVLVLVVAVVPAATADDSLEHHPGFVIVQVDGLSEPDLREALETGAMPFLAGLVNQGSHALGGWRTTSASVTPVTQAGLLRATFDRWLAMAPSPTPAHLADEVCVSSAVEGASGRVCARRDGFGAAWTTELADTLDDDRKVRARVSLDVAEAPDESAVVGNDVDQSTVSVSGRFSPRVGTALRAIKLETCVIVRFAPDRCRTESADLPQLTPRSTPAQRERLEELVFEMPIEQFAEQWAATEREGVDATFDWSSDGCSAGPFRELFDERLEAACLRHDFAYRNYGQLLMGATDDVRERVDEQLAADIAASGQARLSSGFREALQRFGGPAFHDEDLTVLWGVPDFVVAWLGLDDDPGARE